MQETWLVLDVCWIYGAGGFALGSIATMLVFWKMRVGRWRKRE